VNALESALFFLKETQALKIQIASNKESISGFLEEVEAKLGKSFQHEGTYYAIRSRGGKRFLVSSDVPFGSWKKKKAKT